MIVDEKKRIFKKRSFVLKKGKLETFLVVFDECLMEIKLNSYWRFWLSKMLQNEQNFHTND